MMTQPPEHSAPSPRHIAAGLGHATRQEICGMLAMQDAARISQIAGSLSDAARRKLASDAGPAVDRITAFATGLMDGPIPTDALRARLWLTLKEALGLPGLYPLSTRGLESEAAAIAVRASQILAPSVAKARQEKEDAGASALGRSGRNLLRAATGARRQARTAVTFPDIVAHELSMMMESLAEADRRGELDPEIAAAIRKGQRAMSAAALAGGGWAVLAAAVGGAGFAPYIAAAKLSAVIPFVAGPTLTSLLFVMINPVTVIASTAALGYWAVRGQGAAARQIAAARIATLLAVRGQDAGNGMATLLDAFRGLHRMANKDLPHLTAGQRQAVRDHAETVKASLASDIPQAASAAPGLWGMPIATTRDSHRQDISLVAGLTAGDMLYHAAAVDPAVLSAADFSRMDEFDTPLDLAVHVSSFASQGARIALRGYSAEQLVMAQLIEQGHDVALAEGATTPGHDLIVDGVPVQVKCGTSLSLLQDHFATYPGIPVIADTSLAAQARASGKPWEHLVTTISGFDLDHVQALVDHALQAAADLGDVPVPVYAAAIGAARAAHKAWSGQIPVEDLPAWLIIDLSIRGGLASAGQAGGAALGLLVIGPAGALILGPVAGIAALFGRGTAHDLLDRGIRREWHADVIKAAQDVETALLHARTRQVAALRTRLARFRAMGGNLPHQLRTWLEARMAEDLIAAIEAKAHVSPASSLQAAMELLVEASAPDMVDPAVLRARHHLARCITDKPSTTSALRELGTRTGNIGPNHERKK